jgi:hypothetical protein
LLINLPTTRNSELSAWFPGQWRLAQAARITSLQKQASPSSVEHVVRVTHTKVARNLRSNCDSLQKFLIQNADVVQGSSTLKEQ